MTLHLHLPQATGELALYTLRASPPWPQQAAPPQRRRALAAAHVVADPLADNTPGAVAHLDWEATLAYRHYLWSLGFTVAEAMDTAQRGMGLTWPVARELLTRTLREAHACGTDVVCGIGTDQLAVEAQFTLAEIVAAYLEQLAVVEAEGGRAIIMASRALVATARTPDDYFFVYDRVVGQAQRPVILHWLGAMFDPHLAGYWGHHDLAQAMEVVLGIMRQHAARIDGIKLSLLDADQEVAMRRRLPPNVRMYTGDDFHYPHLIAGDDMGHSDALLGIFDAIAPAAAAALHALDAEDMPRYHEILDPTVRLSRWLFGAPTYYYKTGITFLAYLNGHQTHFRMVGGQESARSVGHLARLFTLADEAGLLRDPELALTRMQRVLALAGID